MTGGQPGSYIVEVLAGFHYVRRPFHLIHLHPSLAQELSGRGSTDTRGEFKGVLGRSIYFVFEVY